MKKKKKSRVMTQWEISRAKDEKDSRVKEMWPFTFLPKQVSL